MSSVLRSNQQSPTEVVALLDEAIDRISKVKVFDLQEVDLSRLDPIEVRVHRIESAVEEIGEAVNRLFCGRAA